MTISEATTSIRDRAEQIATACDPPRQPQGTIYWVSAADPDGDERDGLAYVTLEVDIADIRSGSIELRSTVTLKKVE